MSQKSDSKAETLGLLETVMKMSKDSGSMLVPCWFLKWVRT